MNDAGDAGFVPGLKPPPPPAATEAPPPDGLQEVGSFCAGGRWTLASDARVARYE